MTPSQARAMGEAAAKCTQIARMTREELSDYRAAVKDSGRAWMDGELDALIRRERELA